MKSEPAAFLRKSCEFRAKARDELDVVHYADEAGRAACIAGLHAAQALIFEHQQGHQAASWHTGRAAAADEGRTAL